MSDLISRAALLESIKRIADVCYMDTKITTMAALADVSSAVLEAPSAGPRWVPVTESLPGTDRFVLGIVNGKYGTITFEKASQLVEYDGSSWWLDGYPNLDAVNVTHWMPLPEGPTGKEPTNG